MASMVHPLLVVAVGEWRLVAFKETVYLFAPAQATRTMGMPRQARDEE